MVLGGVVQVRRRDLDVAAAALADELGDRLQVGVEVGQSTALALVTLVDLRGEGSGPGHQVVIGHRHVVSIVAARHSNTDRGGHP